MQRHYNALKREMVKRNPNPIVLNAYLNKEFPSRREWLLTIAPEERAAKLLKVYPCFKDHVEVDSNIRLDESLAFWLVMTRLIYYF